MQYMTLKTILSDSAITLTPQQSVEQALDTMARYQISSIIIIDAHKHPIGIFTEYDALRIVTEMIDKQTPICEVMTPEPFCVEESIPFHDAYIIMENKGYRHLIVTDDLGRFVGIASEGDFLRYIGFDEISKIKTVQEAMSESPLVIALDATLIEAAALMKERKCEYAIILDGMHPVGLITERDVLRYCANEKPIDEMKVRDLSQNNFKAVHKDIPLQEASAFMREHGVHQLVVVDEDGDLLGLLGRHDILRVVHGSYFEFLVQLINQKNETIDTLEARKKELRDEKTKAQEHVLKYKKLFEAIPDGTVLVDGKTLNAVEFNRAAHEYLGYTAEEFTKLKISDYEVLESIEEIRRRMEVIKRDGFDNFVTLHRSKQGKLLDIWVSAVAVDIGGYPYIIAVYRDISKQKNIELNLRQKSSFMQTLLKNIPDLVWLKDTEGLYMACNEQFERFFNAKESEIIGRSDFDFVSPELASFFQAHDKAAIAAGGSRINEEFLKFADGSYEGFFETVKTPMKDTEGNIIGVLGIARDISERKEQEAEINKIQALARVGTWIWDIQKDEFKGSPESHRIFGITEGEKITLKDILNKFAPHERERVKDQLLNASQTQHKVGSIYCLNAEEERWIKTHTEFQYDANKKPIKALGIFQEVSEQVNYEKGLKEKDADLSEAQALAHIGSWRFNIKSDFLEWSDETYRIFGVEVGTPFTYENLLEHIHPDDVERVNLAWEAAMGGDAYDIEHRIIVDGEVKWLHEHAKLKVDAEGKFSNAIGTVQEITQRKLYEQKLETLANYDALTGLANRIRFVADLQNATKIAKRADTQVALLMFDLDRFKDINDSYGHNAGDELLKQVAERFTARLRAGDLISRLGGDEFAVVLRNLAHPEDAGRFAQKMIEVLSKNYELSRGMSVHIGASAGIALFPDNADDANMLLQYADAALYKSKAEGRGTYRYYTDELTHLARARIECESNLRLAIFNQEFEVYYQPQVHITSGRIIGAEALVRWNHPTRGVVSPVEFIPVAEDTGLIGEIGEWVLNETCRQGKIWNNQGYRLTLAVNLSAHQIRYQDVVGIVDKALKKSGFEANRLELELTESVLMQREEETVEILHALRAKGIKLAIDDFGTGYSSLSYLKRFPIDVLKIDKSFVDDIPYDADDSAIVTAIIAMAHALGYQVLAEGVEHEEQLRFLQEKGCSMYQGYYKSKPLPVKEFERLLQDY
ncbi:MAG TPA: hypothetical protein CFH84_06815 [Sulfurimonas sp. UBA12504]|nr:MAG: hypothetical protein A2019_07295 [Sulfurimonas sp. GWF2_37_8]DAB29906.1 MAG TPA: hypothetical protein CFH84_06815 [Sulfurimonas sp. UBA12504]